MSGATRRSNGPEPSPLTVDAPEHDRLAMLELLGELKDRASVRLLLDLTTHDDWATVAVQAAAFGALGRFDDPSIASTLLAAYPRKDQAWRSPARELLLSRVVVGEAPTWPRSIGASCRPAT